MEGLEAACDTSSDDDRAKAVHDDDTALLHSAPGARVGSGAEDGLIDGKILIHVQALIISAN